MGSKRNTGNKRGWFGRLIGWTLLLLLLGGTTIPAASGGKVDDLQAVFGPDGIKFDLRERHGMPIASEPAPASHEEATTTAG